MSLIFAAVLAATIATEAQLTIANNSQFTNLVDSKGNIVFTVVKNGQFTNLVDEDGNVAFTLIQNGREFRPSPLAPSQSQQR